MTYWLTRLLPRTWSRGLGFICAFGIGLLTCCHHAELDAQEIDSEQIVRRYADSTWYDSKTKDYKTPNVGSLEEDNPIRTDGNVAKPDVPKAQKSKNSKTNANTQGGGTGTWGAGLADFFSGFTLFWLGLLLICIIGALAYFSFRNYLPGANANEQKIKEIKIDPAKVEELPFEVPEVAAFANPVEQIFAYFQAGRIREAIIMLYGYKLLTLDQTDKIELQKGKTNRQYLRELRKEVQLSSMLETTMLSFEDAFFGDHQITRDRFLASWNTLEEFNRLSLQGSARS